MYIKGSDTSSERGTVWRWLELHKKHGTIYVRQWETIQSNCGKLLHSKEKSHAHMLDDLALRKKRQLGGWEYESINSRGVESPICGLAHWTHRRQIAPSN